MIGGSLDKEVAFGLRIQADPKDKRFALRGDGPGALFLFLGGHRGKRNGKRQTQGTNQLGRDLWVSQVTTQQAHSQEHMARVTLSLRTSFNLSVSNSRDNTAIRRHCSALITLVYDFRVPARR